MQRIIGIDFGTSTTYMNVKRYNGTQPVEDKFSYMPVVFNYGESSGFVASIVRENGDGSFDFGEKAAEPLDGARVYTEVKMRLESPDESERAEARRITREFFKFLHQTYTQQSGSLGSPDDTEETVVSYPVKWKEETSQFMLEAARGAGFQNVRGMDEAEAAMAAVLCQNGKDLILRDKSGYLLLIDMGAGTTDLVVCRYQPRADNGGVQVQLVTSWPQSADEPTFGGREIDAALENYVEGYLSKALNPALAPQARIIATAPGQAKMWKERNVSVTLAADKPVSTCAYISTYKAMGMLTSDFPAFGRKEFEALIDSGLRDYASLLMGCLARASALDARFAASGLDLVILTGGHSAWYFAREIVDGTMPGYLEHPLLAALRQDKGRVVSLPTPQTTVSLGLVYSKLPFKLAKQAEPKKENTEEQKKLKAAQPDGDPDAGYLRRVRRVRDFFANKTCNPNAIQAGTARLNIPKNETVFWAEGIRHGTADPGTYVVTEKGVYLQGDFGGKYHLSWGEFTCAEWADQSFVAPEWRDRKNWADFLPVVIKYEHGPLKALHTYLREAVPETKQRDTGGGQAQGPTTGPVKAPPTKALHTYLREAVPESKQRDTGGRQAQGPTPGPVKAPPTSADGMCMLTLSRPAQFRCAAVKLYVQANQADTYEMSFGSTIKIPVPKGALHLAFWWSAPLMDRVIAHFDINISRNMELSVKAVASGIANNALVLYDGARVVGKSKFKSS